MDHAKRIFRTVEPRKNLFLVPTGIGRRDYTLKS
jgi:hypothetical protein